MYCFKEHNLLIPCSRSFHLGIFVLENSGAWNFSFAFGNSGIKSIFYNCLWHYSQKCNCWMTFPSEMKTDQPFWLNIASSLKFQFGWYNLYWFFPYVPSSIPSIATSSFCPFIMGSRHMDTCLEVINSAANMKFHTQAHKSKNESLKETSRKKDSLGFISLRLLGLPSVKSVSCPVDRTCSHLFFTTGHLLLWNPWPACQRKLEPLQKRPLTFLSLLRNHRRKDPKTMNHKKCCWW